MDLAHGQVGMIGTLFASSSTYLWAVAVLMGGAIASINNPIGYGFLNSGINTMDDGRSQCFDWAIACFCLRT
jgi:hypothetical protein